MDCSSETCLSTSFLGLFPIVFPLISGSQGWGWSGWWEGGDINNLGKPLRYLDSSKGRGQHYTQVGAFCTWNILSSLFLIHFSTSLSTVWQSLDLTRTLLIGTFTKGDREYKHICSKCRKTQQTSTEPSPGDLCICRICHTSQGAVLELMWEGQWTQSKTVNSSQKIKSNMFLIYAWRISFSYHAKPRE